MMSYGEDERAKCDTCGNLFPISFLRHGECRDCWSIGKAEHDADMYDELDEEDDEDERWLL